MNISEAHVLMAIDALRTQAAHITAKDSHLGLTTRFENEIIADGYLRAASTLEDTLPPLEGSALYLALYEGSEPAAISEITLPDGRAKLGLFAPRLSSDGKVEMVNTEPLEMRVPDDDGRSVRSMGVVDRNGRIIHTTTVIEESGPLVQPVVVIGAGGFSLTMRGPSE